MPGLTLDPFGEPHDVGENANGPIRHCGGGVSGACARPAEDTPGGVRWLTLSLGRANLCCQLSEACQVSAVSNAITMWLALMEARILLVDAARFRPEMWTWIDTSASILVRILIIAMLTLTGCARRAELHVHGNSMARPKGSPSFITRLLEDCAAGDRGACHLIDALQHPRS